MKTLANTLIYIAGILWTLETLPQIYKLYKTKKSEDISLAFFIICIIAYINFIIGNIILKNWSVVIAHLCPFVNLIIINILILKYRAKK
jgi:MtN3 and saliva related transmembrane protein